MKRGLKLEERRPLFGQLRWFIRLRWAAGATVIAGALADWRWLGWYGHEWGMLALGVAILVYNAVLAALLWRLRTHARPTRVALFVLAWGQILLDLGCLTLLTLWTGAVQSPLLGFFVFHMVFASLLLPRRMAFGGASAAMLMVASGLWVTDRWPVERGPRMMLLGWIVMLLLTVYLTNHITRGLRRQWRRLARQNRHIRSMSHRLRRQQQAMIQQEKMVALGQMAAGVAHEIANPLASMDSLLQLVQRKPERATPETIGTLREQVDRINQIVRQMTAFAHPTEGQWQTLDLNSVVEGAMQIIRFDGRLRRVRVDRQFSPAAGTVRLLPHAMQQVVVNLVINALDAMADVAEPQLVIRTQRSEQEIHIEVADNGHGIRREHRDHIFEPFFTTKPVGKGTGLGLAISYSLVRKQGGYIDVQSEVGVGTTFTIRLPVSGQGEQAAFPAAGSAVEQHCSS